jgi:CoA:oxalate CoA-transferase
MLAPSALDGIRVVELTHAIAGPHCAQILADHGADVIKVEPAAGESARDALPLVSEGDDSIYFACHNRGKRSAVLDLKSPDGLAALHELVRRCDVLVTNYTVGVPDRNGWGYDVLSGINPRLVMVHISGFGSTGPDRHMRAYDGIIQAMSGIPDYTGTPDSGPVFVAAFVADHVAAYHAAIGAMMALFRRERTGEGAFVDVSMLRAYKSTSAHAIASALDGRPFRRVGNMVSTALTNTFEASDGFVVLAPLGDAKWKQFVQAINCDDWVADLSYVEALAEHRDHVDKLTADWCAERTRAEIVERMTEFGVACGPILTVAEAAERSLEVGAPDLVTVTTPHGRRVPVPAPVSDVGLSSSPRRLSIPAVGEHTGEVLAELAGPGVE